jgi:putative DNA primase/helicase
MKTRKIELSTGTHRYDKEWTAKKITWESFCKRCKETHVGKELYADYLKLPKSRQDELKDVGGFVGAILSGGNRLKRSVLYRTLLTLDIDHMTPEQGAIFWDRFTMFYDCAAVLYSTRKHSTESPRYRLIIPFERNVSPEEYPAVARKVAGSLGIDQFDTTTYQAERLMYWPSVSSDGEFYYRLQDGPFMQPAEVLAEYIGDAEEGSGWRDISQWPCGARESKEIGKTAGIVGNPHNKAGIIGAFCRAYNIHEAIDAFLTSAYAPVEGSTRYTYLKGSTAAGLIVYDYEDAAACFAYSHHGTDPVSGRLVNAFDLVRLHKFGQLDYEIEKKDGAVDFDWDHTKLPSYKQMIEYASLDAGVRLEIGAKRLQDAQEVFADFPDTYNDGAGGTDLEDGREAQDIMGSDEMDYQEEHALDDSQEWLKKLDIEKKTGTIRSTIANVVLILENDPNLKDRFELDDFKQLEILKGKLPWRRVRASDKWITDKDESALRYYLEKVYTITGVQKIRDALDVVMIRHTVHPVREYLKALPQWDGRPRVETVFINYLGAEDSKYTRMVTRKALLACIYRIMKPGVKFDNMLVQVGEEGKGKSLILDKLAGEWFSDSMYTVQGKDAYEQIQGWWIIEMAELSALSKAEGEAIKHFLHKRQDAYRPAFGRKIAIRPRQCVFFGTTNKKNFLKKVNGNRSFWPVEILIQQPTLSVDDLQKTTVDQIWAECLEYFRRGETLKLDNALFIEARRRQEEHTEQDERLPELIAYLDKEVPKNWYELSSFNRRAFLEDPTDYDMKGAFVRDRICVREIWVELFKGQIKDLDRRQSNIIADMMTGLPGWFKADSLRIPGLDRQRGYQRIEAVNR